MSTNLLSWQHHFPLENGSFTRSPAPETGAPRRVPSTPRTWRFVCGAEFEVFPASITEQRLSGCSMALPADRAHRTSLGKRLTELRAKAMERGLALMTEDEVLDEVRLRRGERMA